MKPLKLTMQAFGPYKYKEVVDFKELKDNRLFVISGNTGAGKTTIFDGIVFALYGHASGEDRKEHKSMRSDFADDDTHTQVELIFEASGKKYRVLRQLAHIKTGRKTASGEDYAFMEILPDGTEIVACEKQKSKEISQKIEEIIGLTYDQFNQIVMLPQGEFRKLLTSNTENKEAILRKIFKTERYGKIAERLEQQKKDAEKKRDEAKTIRDAHIDQITGALPERASMLFEHLKGESNIYQIIDGLQDEKAFYDQRLATDEVTYKEAHNRYTIMQQKVTDIKHQNERLQELESKKQDLARKQQLLPQYEAMKKEAEQANIALQIERIFEAFKITSREHLQQQEKVKQLKETYTIAQVNLQEAEQQLQIERQTETERKSLEQEVHNLLKVEPLFDKVEQLEKKVTQANDQFIFAEQNVIAYTTQLIEYAGKFEQLNDLEEQLESEVLTLPVKLTKYQAVKEKLLMIERYEQEVQKYQNAEQDLVHFSNSKNTAEERYKQLESGWLTNQAYELAALLVDGEPCPVCGSTQHEQLHVEQNDISINKEALTQEKNRLDKVSREFYSAEASFNNVKEIVEGMVEQLQEAQIDYMQKALYMEQCIELEAFIKSLEQKQGSLKDIKAERKAVAEKIKQLQIKKEGLASAMQQLRVTIETTKVELIENRKQIPSEYENRATLQRAIERKNNRYKVLQQAFEQAQLTFDTAKTKATQLDEAIRQGEELLMLLANKTQEQQQQWQQALQDSPFETEEQFTASIKTRAQIDELQQLYLAFTNDLFALKQFVEEQSEKLKNVTFEDVAQLEEQLNELKVEYERAFNVAAQTKNYIETCQQYIQKLSAVAQKIVELEEIADSILNLYNVLKGNNTKKISFERYVQIDYLEKITDAANIRLHNLSNGQYKLVSSDRQVGHGRKSGLSLDVYDSYTGQNRDVKTLSGGEKFNASLCLALGMADVIQSFQGNVRIDTMFIDEGFGSLDEESLMRAIDTLIDLQKSGRIIGVISHVAELKAAIPAVLEVMKLKEGYSKTQFILK